MAAPQAAGKRFLALADGPALSFVELAAILRDRLGDLAALAPTTEADGPARSPRPVIHNDRARQELGWRPRPVRDDDRGVGGEPAGSRLADDR